MLDASRLMTNSAAWAWNRRSSDGGTTVDRVPQELVPEVVVAVVDVMERVDDRCVDELLERRLELAPTGGRRARPGRRG